MQDDIPSILTTRFFDSEMPLIRPRKRSSRAAKLVLLACLTVLFALIVEQNF